MSSPHIDIVKSMLSRCLSIDLEIGVTDNLIHQFAAVRGDNSKSYRFNKGNLNNALKELDYLAIDLDFLLGHNLIAFDIPHLQASDPRLKVLNLPCLDTLRISPLAFPRNPYHRLVKHYQDGQLERGRINNPELDSQLTLVVLEEQILALVSQNELNPDLLLVWHWLTSSEPNSEAFDTFFSLIRSEKRPNDFQYYNAILKILEGKACVAQAQKVVEVSKSTGWDLAYALAWISVSGGNSVVPPWVRHQFPRTSKIIHQLRNKDCENSSCSWCSNHNNAQSELNRFFGFNSFRPEPIDSNGNPLQKTIVESAMRGEHVLGILPTGTGKSLCYQIPALSRYEKTGSLTVVISPLVALMADQVAGLQAKRITSCAAINGLLSMPERSDVLERVRLGDVAILIISPEQLRNRSLKSVLAQREIGGWVMDEAHCLSKWGHDFRPDYRYVGRVIKELSNGNIPPILCLTATAKPDVKIEIAEYFREKMDIELKVFDGGSTRINIEFSVIPTSSHEKLGHILSLINDTLGSKNTGGCIVYCSTRDNTEVLANDLKLNQISAAFFHAGLSPEDKKMVQTQFIDGGLKVIVATNAFGMGIDKPDVRLVIHADIPGSLENYVQEAGRAGRDRDSAQCILLYTPDDVERQFSLSARSKLSRRDIQSILKSIKRLDRKKRFNGEVIATSGEILSEDSEGEFEKDSSTDDTRVRTAISWLEESALLSREENNVQIFPSSLKIFSIEDAHKRLEKFDLRDEYRRQLLSIVQVLLGSKPDKGVSTDQLMSSSGLNIEKLRGALYDLEKLGVASNDTVLTAFIHQGVDRSSLKRFEEAVQLEKEFIRILRESAPDLSKEESTQLNIRVASQKLHDLGYITAGPSKILDIVKGISRDGVSVSEDSGRGSIRFKRSINYECVDITLQREWSALEKIAQIRRKGAELVLQHLISRLPDGSRGLDLLASTTLGNLLQSLQGDLLLMQEVKDLTKLLDRGLLWLNDLEIIKLNKGLAIFRPAMIIHLEPGRRGFTNSDYIPLQIHYDAQTTQIHVMAEYVERALKLKSMRDALQLAEDYFCLHEEVFLQKWLPNRKPELKRQTTPASWRSIVENLKNLIQQQIVADDRDNTNVLVLAGPGSGKTRVLVHRIAYLIRVKRENPIGIVALAYNRHAAVEIRKRLFNLVGDDAKGVTVMTLHGLAMRLVGASFANRPIDQKDAFKKILNDATALLQGTGLVEEEADEQRDRLLGGFHWIFVDEYQDIGPEQYELISALAGRKKTEDGKLCLFAVGDDDQNIYAFEGASVEYIRRFETDYETKPAFLIENYRSTGHIIAAANSVISKATQRMKVNHPIRINRSRIKDPLGGNWEKIDPVGKGKVQLIRANNMFTQAIEIITEFERLSKLDENWNWSETAVIAREWKYLDPVRSYCELKKIPVQMADEETSYFWRLRETQKLIRWIHLENIKLINKTTISNWILEQPTNDWWELLLEAVHGYFLEVSGGELPTHHFIEWLAEWGREFRKKQTGILLLTSHRAKGLEFNHVAVLDGGWERTSKNEDGESARRLFYVAMTRAKNNLILSQVSQLHPFLQDLANNDIHQRIPIVANEIPEDLKRIYNRLNLSSVDLGFAGRHDRSHPIHNAISKLQPGDLLSLQQKNDKWELLDQFGVTVSRLSKSFSPPSQMQCISVKIMAIIIRRREDSNPEYQSLIKTDEWEVILPELVFQ